MERPFEVISKRPVLLQTRAGENMNAVEAWLRRELGWSDKNITNILRKDPVLFCSNPVVNLAPKLAWFDAHVRCTEKMSKVLANHPQLFHYSIERNESNMSAMQAMGLSELQVSGMVGRMPQLLGQDMSGFVIQTG